MGTFFEVDLKDMDQGVRDASGYGESNSRYVKQKGDLDKFGKVYAFKVLLPDAASFDFYRTQKTLPVATMRYGWFEHPTKIKTKDDGTKTAHRFFHVSPSCLGEIDEVDPYLKKTLRNLPGFMGAPEEHVHEVVRIFRSLYTNSNPQHRSIGQPSAKMRERIEEKLVEDFPGYTPKQYKEMSAAVRELWRVWKTKYIMPIIPVSEKLTNGQSVPLVNETHILEMENTLRNAIFHPEKGLLAQNSMIPSEAVAESKNAPFQAYKKFLHPNPGVATYDIFIQCFENRQFVGDSPNKKGYGDFTAWFRNTPTTLADGEKFYAQENLVDLLTEVRDGVRDQAMVVDCFRTHFGEMTPEEFDAKHAEADTDGSKRKAAATEAEELAEEAKAKTTKDPAKKATKAKAKPKAKAEAPAPVEEAPEEDETADKVAELTAAIEGLETVGVDIPDALLDQYQQLTGHPWGEAVEEADQPEAEEAVEEATEEATEETAEEAVEEAVEEAPVAKPKRRRRKRADV